MNEITRLTSVAEIVKRCPTARRIFDNPGLKGCGGEALGPPLSRPLDCLLTFGAEGLKWWAGERVDGAAVSVGDPALRAAS
mgnify:FL=1